MTSVSMFEAKTNLSRYVTSVASGEESFIVIMKNGRPVAKIVPYEAEVDNRIGIAKGRIPMMPALEDFNGIDVEGELYSKGELL